MSIPSQLHERLKNLSFNRIVLLFCLLFLFLVIDTVVSYKNLMTLIKREQRVEYSSQITNRLKDILTDSVGAETGERGYVITGNPSYLSPYISALGRVDQDLNDLVNISQNHPSLRSIYSQIPDLRQRVNEELSVLKSTINLREQSSFEDAQAKLQSGEEKQKMDALRAKINQLEKITQATLDFNSQSLRAGIDTAILSFTISTLANTVLLVLVFWLVNNEFIRRAEFERRKDEFMSIASHELKTPLTTMKVITQVLIAKLKPTKNKELLKHLNRLDKQADNLTELINELLDVSKIQAGEIQYKSEVFDLDELVKECVESIQSTTKKHQIIIKGRVSHKVLGDQNRIAQVLTNFLTNAVKYSPQSNKVIVHVSKNDRTSARIGVQDFGIGIDSSQLNRVFDRFYRVSDPSTNSIPGLGIGLYISSDIIKRHGGRIWVESEKGKGSTFFFVLPFKPPRQRRSLKRKRVLNS